MCIFKYTIYIYLCASEISLHNQVTVEYLSTFPFHTLKPHLRH